LSPASLLKSKPTFGVHKLRHRVSMENIDFLNPRYWIDTHLFQRRLEALIVATDGLMLGLLLPVDRG
jgi:hypothetical protein